MGYYINTDSKGNQLGYEKVKPLIEDGARRIGQPKEWREGIVCVVNNGLFDAACYCYNQSELEACSDPNDYREKVWLEYEQAKELAK